MLYFLFMYSIGQLKAAGGVWYAVTGLDPLWCLLLSIFIAWLYMVLGGYVGTQWSMAFQGMLLGFVGALLGIWAIISCRWLSGNHPRSCLQEPKVGPELIKLMRPDLPKLGSTQFFSSLVGILATPVIFFTMAVGFPHNVEPVPRDEKDVQERLLLAGRDRLADRRHTHHARLLEQRPCCKDALRSLNSSRSNPGRETWPHRCWLTRWVEHP